jgi:hypothetical protein
METAVKKRAPKKKQKRRGRPPVRVRNPVFHVRMAKPIIRMLQKWAMTTHRTQPSMLEAMIAHFNYCPDNLNESWTRENLEEEMTPVELERISGKAI